jgi:hypothetical protein
MDVLGGDLPKQNRSFGRVSSLLLGDILLIIGVGLGILALLSLAVYLSAKYRRKRRRHVSGGEKVYRGSSADADESDAASVDDAEDDEPEDVPGEEADGDADGERHHHQHNGRRRYKYRVKRRTHRTRNPTLSEAGGLPPVKPPEPTGPR